MQPSLPLDPQLAPSSSFSSLASLPAPAQPPTLPTPSYSIHALDPALLPEPPDDPLAQIRLLREMDDDADAALVANKRYQDELLLVLDRLDRARKRTLELETLIDTLEAEMTAPADLRVEAEGVSEPTLPWFKHFYGKDLPPNPDGEARERYLTAVRSVPWSAAERAQLKQEVIAQNHRLVAFDAQARGVDVADALAEVPSSWFVESVKDLDWDRIALVLERRTATECRIQWTQKDHPLINTAKWVDDELKTLEEIVEEHEGHDWAAIAEALGTNRTPADCLRQHRQREVKRLRKEARQEERAKALEWNDEADERLREAIDQFGETWDAVADYTGYPSGACYTRWTAVLRPLIKRGKWSTSEDDALRSAVAELLVDTGYKGREKGKPKDKEGGTWKEIAARVSGRTDAQCRERWQNILDPKLLDNKVWTEEEEALIVRMRDEEKLSWAEIAHKGFDDRRTDNNCMRRYADIKKRLLPPDQRPRIGRPPKSLRGRGRPKKTAKMRAKEEAERRRVEMEIEREVEALERGEEVPLLEGDGAVEKKIGRPRGSGKGKGKAKAQGKGKAREEAVDVEPEENGVDAGDDDASPGPSSRARPVRRARSSAKNAVAPPPPPAESTSTPAASSASPAPSTSTFKRRRGASSFEIVIDVDAGKRGRKRPAQEAEADGEAGGEKAERATRRKRGT
ncbi:hypothetical protein JCM10207_006634 [Rhodosporidiobolus poonsookiae]